MRRQSRSGSRSACWAISSDIVLGNCWPRPGWHWSRAGSARGWSARRERFWYGRAVNAFTASACGSAKPAIFLQLTASRTCCWRSARTRRDSRPWRTGTSPGRAGGCCWSCRRGRGPPYGPREPRRRPEEPWGSGLLVVLPHLLVDVLHHRRVAEGGDVADLAALAYVTEQAAHDLAGAGLGEIIGPDDSLRAGDLGDPVRDVLVD